MRLLESCCCGRRNRPEAPSHALERQRPWLQQAILRARLVAGLRRAGPVSSGGGSLPLRPSAPPASLSGASLGRHVRKAGTVQSLPSSQCAAVDLAAPTRWRTRLLDHADSGSEGDVDSQTDWDAQIEQAFAHAFENLSVGSSSEGADVAVSAAPASPAFPAADDAIDVLAFHRRASQREPMIPLLHSDPIISGQRYAMGWWRLQSPPPYARRPPACFGVPGNTVGKPYLNAMGMVEERGLAVAYRVEPKPAHTAGQDVVEPLPDPRVQGFKPDMILAGNCHYTDDRHLFTMETWTDAAAYGRQRYGEGNFLLYRIRTTGLPVVRYRRHVQYCQPESGPMDAAHWLDPAARRGDVYLDIRDLPRDNIQQVETTPRSASCAIA